MAAREILPLYSEAEARICLSCPAPVCRGECEHLKREKALLYKEILPPPLFELDTEAEDDGEFILPDTPPWPKKNPYISKDKGD